MRSVAPILIALLVVVSFLPRAALAQRDATPVEALFERGQQAFDDGLALRRDNPRVAAESFRSAASMWQSIVDEYDRHNGRLLYNIGNAHLLAGEVGPAILAYRRAERFIAGDRHLVANLQQARQRVRTSVEPSATDRARGMLLFWHEDWSPRTRLTLLTLLWGAGWIWALLRLSGRFAAWPRWPGWSAAMLAIVLGASLAIDQLGDEVAGVVMRETIGRKGPSDAGYEPSFTDPLAEGVEFTAIENRGEWLLTRLRDGRETWLERGSVAMIE